MHSRVEIAAQNEAERLQSLHEGILDALHDLEAFERYSALELHMVLSVIGTNALIEESNETIQ